MSDPTDIAPVIGASAGGGALVTGVLMGLLKWSGSRNINQLDHTLQALNASVAELTKQVQNLREANIGLAKDLGALQESQKNLQHRVDGQAQHWREEFEKLRRRK